MRIHHLNCGRHAPIGGAFYDGTSRGLVADICTHCLLIETDRHGLVLVDTGYGLRDVPGNGPRRLARLWPFVLRPRLREADTARRQVEALGFPSRDVRHIVLTHLDFDHAGGIEDFPEAAVHVLETERSDAEASSGLVGHQRYRPRMWDEVRDWHTYAVAGEPWFGFDAVRALDGLPPEILMIPLPGHTRGHAGVAIATSGGWLLDAGDAYLHRGELDPGHPHMPPGLALYERIMMADPWAARANLRRLRDLTRSHAPEVEIFCSHDTSELAAMAKAQPVL